MYDINSKEEVVVTSVEKIKQRDRTYVWHPWSPLKEDRSQLTFSYGKGYFVWDIEGKKYIDATSLNLTCGYGHPVLVTAITNQLLKFHSTDISIASHECVGLLAERLAKYLPEGLSKTLFVNSGSEAFEAAIFIAASYWAQIGKPRSRIVTFARGYHGSTFVSRSLSGLPRVSHPFGQAMPVTRVELPVRPKELKRPESLSKILESFERAIKDGVDQPIAVVVEPFLNVGGGIVLPLGFLNGLRKLCDSTNTLLIVDEVFTGHGRTGRMFAFEYEAIVPDILVASKGLASGYVPISAVHVQKLIHDTFEKDPYIKGLRYGHTTSGHPAACAAAIATLDIIESENLCKRAETNGKLLLENVSEICRNKKNIVDVRGFGLNVVIETDTQENAFNLYKNAEAAGLLMRRCGEALMIVPPLTIDSKGIVAITKCLEKIFSYS